MSDDVHVGTYWINLTSHDSGDINRDREEIKVFCSGMLSEGTYPSVNREEAGLRFQRSSGGFSFLPWSAIRRLEYMTAEEIRLAAMRRSKDT